MWRGTLRIAAGAAIGCFGAWCLHRPLDPHEMPLRCSIDALPTKASQTTVARLCGAPYTANTSFENGKRLDEWVYDAGTFLWFRDGVLAFEKVDERHVPEQAKMSHTRAPFSMCE